MKFTLQLANINIRSRTSGDVARMLTIFSLISESISRVSYPELLVYCFLTQSFMIQYFIAKMCVYICYIKVVPISLGFVFSSSVQERSAHYSRPQSREISNFIFKRREYPCNNTYDIFSLIDHGYFFNKKIIYSTTNIFRT